MDKRYSRRVEMRGVRAVLVFAVLIFTIDAPQVLSQETVRLPGFGTKKGKRPILGFGPQSKEWLLVTEADLGTARSWMSRYDKDRSGALESKETSGWSPGSHRLYDLNSNGTILLRELAVGVARNRLKSAAARQSALKAQRAKAKKGKRKARTKPPVRSARPVDPVRLARQATCNNLAAELIAERDRNRNKQLELSEWKSSANRFSDFSSGADTNGDTTITRTELAAWLMRRMPPLATARLAKSLRLLDVNGDGQITLREFAAEFDQETLARFRASDKNNDGVISPAESHAAPVPIGRVGFASSEARFIKPKSTAISKLWIDKDLEIEDLDVRVAITKLNDANLQLYLIGPDGQRVTLFAGGWQPWTGAFIFESTLIDDDAPLIKATLPQAPFPRRLRSDGLKKGGPGLKHYYGKSTRGTWQLMAVGTDDKAGVLHHWSLWVKPKNRP